MLVKSPQGNIVEKILRDKDGRLVRAIFRVYEIDGRIKARLVKAVLMDEALSIENKVLKLGSFNPKKVVHSEIVYQSRVISPYLNNNLLYFSGSKPRAPASLY